MANDLLLPFGLLAGSFALIGVFFIVLYVYFAWAFMKVAQRAGAENPWLAWIPIANMFYIAMVAGYEWYYGFLWFLGAIPFVGGLASLGLTIWWWWKISEKINKPGWMGVLMAIPVVNLIAIGVLAWSKD